MQLLPCAKNVCPACAVDHPIDTAHNAESIYYQYLFFGRHGRWPTWADAIAHCDERIREMWRDLLRNKDAWSEPTEGDPIPIRAGVVDGQGVELTPETSEAPPC